MYNNINIMYIITNVHHTFIHYSLQYQHRTELLKTYIDSMILSIINTTSMFSFQVVFVDTRRRRRLCDSRICRRRDASCRTGSRRGRARRRYMFSSISVCLHYFLQYVVIESKYSSLRPADG